jgi:hypothetical protein
VGSDLQETNTGKRNEKMMAGRDIVYVERAATDAVLRAARLLAEAGDERGALRELGHFVSALGDKVLVPLGYVIEKAAGEIDEFPWIVKSRPERFGLSI